MPKGQKNQVSKENFKRATKGAGITKGILSYKDFVESVFADSKGQEYTKTKDNFVAWVNNNKIPTDTLYIYTRYKNIPFAFDTKTKTLYQVSGCCVGYEDVIQYFLDNNIEYQDNIVNVDNVCPVDIHNRQSNISKQIESIGIVL